MRRVAAHEAGAADFSYVPNTSFRGPEHLWVEWDPARIPSARTRRCAKARACRCASASRRSARRTLVVERVDRSLKASSAAPGRARLSAAAALDARFAHRCRVRRPGLVAPVLAVQRSGRARRARDRGAARDRGPRRLGLDACQRARRRPRRKMRGPRNHFRLDEQAGKLGDFIAGGIGITPISAMARRAKSLGLDYTLHYSGRRARDHGVSRRARRGCTAPACRSTPSDEGGATTSRALLATPDRDTQVYACGPVRMLAGARGGCAAGPKTRCTSSTSSRPSARSTRPRSTRSRSSSRTPASPCRSPPTRRCSARCARRTSTSRATARKACAARARCACSPAKVDHRDVVLTRAEREANTKMMTCCSRARGKKLVLEL